MKVLLCHIHLNSHTLRFHPQTLFFLLSVLMFSYHCRIQKLVTILMIMMMTLGQGIQILITGNSIFHVPFSFAVQLLLPPPKYLKLWVEAASLSYTPPQQKYFVASPESFICIGGQGWNEIEGNKKIQIRLQNKVVFLIGLQRLKPTKITAVMELFNAL